MQALIDVILPVFLVLGSGYFARWRGWMSDDHIDGLMRFTQGFALPALLFRGIESLDLGLNYDLGLLGSYYLGALASFGLGLYGARLLFRRPWEDCVAIGFCALYSNSLLLGVPITERAYGADALGPNFAIVSLYAPFCYGVGLTAMEIVRARGKTGIQMLRAILSAMFRNALVIGIALGLFVNLAGIPIPLILGDAIDMVVRAALPAALFGLGGVLYRYRPEGDAGTIAFICGLSLIIQPAIVWLAGGLAGLSTGQMRSAVLTAAMASGVNTYIFANIYGVARRVVASSVLIGTALSLLSIWVWLAILP